jgi:5'-3' exonuclease
MNKPEYISKVLVDGDVVAYRASASAENDLVDEAYNKVDDLMGYIIQETVSFPTSDTFKVYLSGKSNFRHSVAKSHGYKANRTQPKPIHLAATRDYLVREYGAVISSGCEADDLIAMEVMKGDPESTVIASIDKDFQTVSCWWFNFTKDEWKYSTEWDALKFFYEQVLTGDAVDNIKGIHRVGPVKAKKILEGATTEEDLFQKCLDAYEGDLERVIENAQLLHLQRYKGELWTPPTERVT